jgi:fucose permease
LLALGSAAFVLFGVVLVLLGVCHVGLTESLHLNHMAFGLLGSALSFGIGAGVLAAGPLVDRFPRRPTFLTSTLIVAAALLSVDAEMSFGRAAMHVAVMGFGAGIFDTLLNAVTVERWGEESVRPMAWLHAMVPAGAIATPWVVAQAGGSSEWTWLFHLTGAAFLALSIWVACVPLPAPANLPATPERGGLAPFLRPTFLALAGVGLAYVGIEAALSMFAVPYAHSGLGLTEGHGQRAISAMWLGVLVGRLLMTLPTRPFDARAIAASGLAGALVIGVGAGLELRQVEWVMGACGLALSGVFPLMISLAGQAIPEARGKAVGVVAGLGSVGGFALPPLTGALADVAGIETAILSLSAWSLAIALAGWAAYARA